MPPVKKAAARTAAAAAQAEVTDDSKILTFNGEDFDVPAEVPFAFAAFLQEGELLNAIRGLVDPDDFVRFMGATRGLSVSAALEALTVACEETYGVQQGG